MHEGRCCSELGLPGWPAIAEELMVHRDIELARLTGARDPPPPPLDGAERRPRPGRQGRRPRRHRRGGTAPLQPHRRGAARLRPGVQGQPATAHRGRRGGDQGRARRRHDRRHRHRPRAAPDRGEGATARRCPARDARPGDGARRGPGAARHALVDVVAPAVVEAGGDRRSRRPARWPDRARCAGEPHRVRSRRDVDGAAGAPRQPEPQHPVRRAHGSEVGSGTRSTAATAVVRDGMSIR